VLKTLIILAAATATPQATLEQINICRQVAVMPNAGDVLTDAMREAGWSVDEQRDMLRLCLAYSAGRIDGFRARETF